MDYLITVPISKLPGVNWQKMLPVSMNEYIRMKWQIRDKLNNLWYDYMFSQVNNQHIPMLVNPRILVKIYFPLNRRRDWTNFCFKPIYDALVKAGVMKDDNDKDANIMRPRLYVDLKHPRTEIFILENPDNEPVI